MDHLKHPNSKLNHNHSLSHKFINKMKTSIQFLLCFSLFCVLFSSLPLFLQSVKPFLMQFFSYMVEKSYMFLLCNGLLAVIAMNSGLVSSSSPPTTHHSPEHPAVVEAVEVVAHTEKTILPDSNESNIAVAAPISAEETESPQEKETILFIVEQENVVSSSSEMQEEEKALAIIEEDELAVDDNEELNRKCDDFIKRMKATFSSNNLELRAMDGFYFSYQNSLVTVVN
ncbi:uncharacterized protein HKW66_Vig0254140 [Vigna angularis]|uniref:DUF4408 domain-containing protein n=3 Tax=Phaseolus angularis TaxID=3914 RepID=A0A8T0K0W4_PHAAN|nr:uncharacterized protein LOC108337727 [Vigna angularis]KAG2390648.1 uncharacterized protein HKW66_Vig0254140 [Vigna angularis]BAT80479.1 hypothetical protein VIGAN_03006600 [Vigna angularis var. angularis]